MKKLIHILINIALTMIVLVACTDEDIVKESLSIVEGKPVEISLGFSAGKQSVQTRVEQEPETEAAVHSLYIFVFNSDGTLDGGIKQLTEDEITNNSFTLNTNSGANKTLVGIANPSTTIANQFPGITSLEKLEALTETMDTPGNLNRTSFLMTRVLTVDITTDNGIYDKQGQSITNIDLNRADAKITFQIKLGNLSDEEDVTDVSNLQFTPTGFTVYNVPNGTYLLPNDEDSGTGYSHSVVGNSFDSSSADDMSFNFYMFESRQNVLNGADNYIDENVAESNEVDNLYVLREKQEKTSVTDPNNPQVTEENGEFKYAPATSTYVVFTGDLSYQRKKNGIQQWVNASVSYTVHLGETGNREEDYNNPEKVNNYTVSRNVHYTYTITITGVNSIRVEVQDDKETRPGYEGDVIIAGAQVKSIDSHYGRALFYLTKDALKGGLSWVIQTPFDNGIKINDAATTSLKDYKWILFAVNSEFGIGKGSTGITSPIDGQRVNMVKFPGYDAYDGGLSAFSENSSDAYNDEGNSSNNVLKRGNWKSNIPTNNFYEDYASYLTDDACLRDINQLLNHLRIEANKENSPLFVTEKNDQGIEEERVYITAFIDEYIYRYDPRTEDYIDPRSLGDEPGDEERLKLWKEVVNGSSRLMHICTGGVIYSDDGNSTWTESVVTFSQSPVYTMYNEQADHLDSAWGTETIIEGGVLEATPVTAVSSSLAASSGSFTVDGKSYYNTNSNGRVNTLMFFVDSEGKSAKVKWGNVLNRTDDALNNPSGEELKSDYRDIWHACMIRNRDLNGDNIIQPEEVRWFLASVDELTDLWIGEDAMPASAKLYQGSTTSAQRLHVASSSYYDGYRNPFVIWAEEGASRGSYSYSSKNDNNEENKNGTKYYYRCIRYLGLSLDDMAEEPQPFAEYDNTTRTIDVTYLASRAKRTAYDEGTELPYHTERGTTNMNKPYVGGFEVASSMTTEGAVGRRWENEYNQGSITKWGFGTIKRVLLCPSGYRIPNQRELMLMYTRMGSDLTDTNLWCSTRFSFNGHTIFHGIDRPGFAYNSPVMVLTSTNTSRDDNRENQVRCVRDVVNNGQ